MPLWRNVLPVGGLPLLKARGSRPVLILSQHTGHDQTQMYFCGTLSRLVCSPAQMPFDLSPDATHRSDIAAVFETIVVENGDWLGVDLRPGKVATADYRDEC